jgi:hypothetical protein
LWLEMLHETLHNIDSLSSLHDLSNLHTVAVLDTGTYMYDMGTVYVDLRVSLTWPPSALLPWLLLAISLSRYY